MAELRQRWGRGQPRPSLHINEGGCAQRQGSSAHSQRRPKGPLRPHPTSSLVSSWKMGQQAGSSAGHSLPASKGPFSSRPKVLQEPAVETSSCASVSAAPGRVCTCVLTSVHWALGPGFPGGTLWGSSERSHQRPGPSLTVSWACGGHQASPPGLAGPEGFAVEATRPIPPAWVCRGHGPHALLFWGGPPDCQAFGGSTPSLVETEAEKGDPLPELPPSSCVL